VLSPRKEVGRKWGGAAHCLLRGSGRALQAEGCTCCSRQSTAPAPGASTFSCWKVAVSLHGPQLQALDAHIDPSAAQKECSAAQGREGQGRGGQGRAGRIGQSIENVSEGRGNVLLQKIRGMLCLGRTRECSGPERGRDLLPHKREASEGEAPAPEERKLLPHKDKGTFFFFFLSCTWK